jgi:hypothetical protein
MAESVTSQSAETWPATSGELRKHSIDLGLNSVSDRTEYDPILHDDE